MRTTTVAALASAFTEQIRQITPSSTGLQDHPWRPVEDVDLVASGEVRTFYVEIIDVAEVTDGINSPSAGEYSCTALVWTSYGNVKRDVFRGLVGEDGRQVRIVLAVRVDATTDSTIAGLVSCTHEGWQDEGTEQGRFWGAHILAVRFLAAGVPGAS